MSDVPPPAGPPPVHPPSAWPPASPPPTGPQQGWGPTGAPSQPPAYPPVAQTPYDPFTTAPGGGGVGGPYPPTGPTPPPGGDGPNKVLIGVLVAVIVLGLIGILVVLLSGDDDGGTASPPSTAPAGTVDEAEEPTTTTTEPEPPTTVEPELVSVFEMRVGDCWNDPDGTSDTDALPVVPCEQAHDKEVFLLFDMEGDVFDQAAIEPAIEEHCIPAFEEYVDSPYATSLLYINYIAPTEATWAEGDREVICSVYDGTNDEPLVGSAKGSGL